MKKATTLSTLILFLFALPARGQVSVCMTDGFGFSWNLVDDDGDVRVMANWTTGSGSSIDTAGGWSATGMAFGTLDKATRSLSLEADNQDDVPCILESDQFIYTGSRTGHLTYAGDWTSYCGGDMVSSGTWSGTFKLASCGQSVNRFTPGILPTMSRKSARASRSLIASKPAAFALDGAYPNPFSTKTTIGYTLLKSGIVSVRVYNLLGEEVATLTDGFQSEGRYSMSFDASYLSAGVYLYVMQTENHVETHKIILMK